MTSTPSTSVVLVDDHDLIRHGLTRAFERAADFEIAGQAGSIAEARELVARVGPEVVISDVRLPDGSGLDLVAELRERRRDLGLVVLTMYAGDDQLFAAMEAGASAFVPKDAPAAEVVAAARHAVVAPQSFTATALADAMRRRMSRTSQHLSAREREVLSLLAEGCGTAQVARHLYVSESTAKSHIASIYEKLGAANRAQAIMCAVRMGLLTDK